MSRFLDGLKGLGAARLAAIGAVGLLVLGIIGGVAVRSASQPMALLYGDLDLRDSGQITGTLEKLHVAYELKAGGSQIMVPSDQVDRLRITLAHDGIPAGGSVGYEIFDRGDSLTTSQFQQHIDQLRALEGELARTIRTIHGVRNARVHLVLPKREPFAREQQDAQASVVLAVAGAGRMDNEEVQAILNLVASAVPGLKAENISIVDQRGQLLARAGHVGGADGGGQSRQDMRLAMEQRLSQSVEDMLSRTLGPGHVRAETTVEMDFDRSNQTEESYNPDQQVVRSQQTNTTQSRNTEAAQSVTVQNNLPNPDQQNGGSGSSESHSEENTNYDIGKTVRTVVRDTPILKHLSMAVLVDGTAQVGADGKSTWRPLAQADLDRISTLVKSAIGYDEKRGDHVEVVNMRFAAGEDIGEPAPSGFFGIQLAKADLFWLVTVGTIALVALFALAFVVRPLALRLATRLPEPAALEGPADPTTPLLAGSAGAVGQIAGEEDETMLNVANIDGQMRASSMRRLTETVENQPDASLGVMRGWLAQKVG